MSFDPRFDLIESPQWVNEEQCQLLSYKDALELADLFTIYADKKGCAYWEFDAYNGNGDVVNEHINEKGELDGARLKLSAYYNRDFEVATDMTIGELEKLLTSYLKSKIDSITKAMTIGAGWKYTLKIANDGINEFAVTIELN